MAFIIPNAVDTSSGSKFENLDQAEPDSLDFEILGNAGRSGVVRGCEVTASSTPSNATVELSSGVVVIDGLPHAVAATTVSLPASPTETRFDLVVARANGTSADIIVIAGNDDATNPSFPQSRKTLANDGDYDNTIHVDLDSEVVLAALYRSGPNTVTTQRITDRRLLLTTGIVDQGTAAPSVSSGDTGNLFYKKGVPTGSSSGVYVKTESNGWIELAQNIGSHVPVGGIIAWPMHGTLPSGFVEANGQALSKTQYSALYSVYGTYYNTLNGASDPGTANFRVPNLSTRVLKGTANTTANSADSVGKHVGRDSDTLTTAQLPSHQHSLGGHTHTLSHTHSIEHDHPNTPTDGVAAHNHGSAFTIDNSVSHFHGAGNLDADAGGVHGHGAGTLDADSGGAHLHDSGNIALSDAGSHSHAAPTVPNASGYVLRLTAYSTNYRAADTTNHTISGGMAISDSPATKVAGSHTHSLSGYTGSALSNHIHNVSGNTADSLNHVHNVSGNTGSDGVHSHTITGDTSGAGNHSHNVDIEPFSGNSGSANVNTTSGSNTDTGGTGTGDNVSFIPSAGYVRWIIRASHGTDSATLGGTSLFDEAREEVVTFELVESGANVTTGIKSSYRLPWGAQLTDVRASLGYGSTASTSGSVEIDVLEDSVSVLSTALSIDATETSSTTAASAVAISDSDLADDSLLTFDITSAGTGAVGPLTVTLYLSRDA